MDGTPAPSIRLPSIRLPSIRLLDRQALSGSRRQRTSPIAIQLTRRRFMAAACIGASMSIGNHFAAAQASAVHFDFSKPLAFDELTIAPPSG